MAKERSEGDGSHPGGERNTRPGTTRAPHRLRRNLPLQRFLLRGGKRNAKNGAAFWCAGAASGPDFPLMLLHNGFGDGQTQAGTAFAFGGEIRVEDPGADQVWNPMAVI